MTVHRHPVSFEEIDHTADVGIVVRGDSERDTLAHLVLAMSHLLSGGGDIAAGDEATIEVAPDDRAGMAIDVLRELLFRFDCEHVIAASCEVLAFSTETGARVSVRARSVGRAAARRGTELKAVTFHEASFERDGAGWRAQVVFDVECATPKHDGRANERPRRQHVLALAPRCSARSEACSRWCSSEPP